ncbi:MAG: 50S ribosomal protein L17 [bacterium]
MGRDKAHRKALLANLVRSLLFHEEIITTEAKAKEAARFCERVISLAKEDSVHHRRSVLKFIHDKKVIKKLFDVIGPRYRDRKGGCTRIIRLRYRQGDDALMCKVKLV